MLFRGGLRSVIAVLSLASASAVFAQSHCCKTRNSAI
jgi:hypothetical protein